VLLGREKWSYWIDSQLWHNEHSKETRKHPPEILSTPIKMTSWPSVSKFKGTCILKHSENHSRFSFVDWECRCCQSRQLNWFTWEYSHMNMQHLLQFLSLIHLNASPSLNFVKSTNDMTQLFCRNVPCNWREFNVIHISVQIFCNTEQIFSVFSPKYLLNP
jgi:hypothetical protein